MANAYTLARAHLATNVAEAKTENIDLNSYGQALVWELIELYKSHGRSAADIIEEIRYTLDNIDDDGTFHVSRN